MPITPDHPEADEIVSLHSDAGESLRLEPGPGGKIDAGMVRRLVDAAGEEAEDDAELRRVTFTLQRDIQKRLDKYLVDRITFMSRTALQRLIDEGGVLVNGRFPKASTVLRARDVVEVVVPTPPDRNIQPEDIPLEVLFEDDYLIVLNKQPDIIVHPARTHLKGTMLSALAYHFLHRTGGGLSKVGEKFARPGVVHRLDRHTSGCIVFAKQDEAHWKLGHQFEHRTVEKRYITIVHGRLEPPGAVIEAPIGPHPSREKGYREKYVVRHDALGKPAVTIYRVREWYTAKASGIGDQASGRTEGGSTETGASDRAAGAMPIPMAGWNADRNASEARPSPASTPPHRSGSDGRSPMPDAYSLVEIELKTGRTHQIRVHLSHEDHPIVGDDMYGGKPYPPGTERPKPDQTVDDLPPAKRPIIAHPALHAALLAFDHPITGERLTFTAPLRGEVARLVASLRAKFQVDRPDLPGCVVDLDHMMSRLDG
jgi:RluA family pseudouridine synthase